MKIGVLGTGDVGRALARAFVTRGHDVMLGSRSPRNARVLEAVMALGPRARVGTFAEAAEFGQLAVIATLGAATEAVLREVGPDRLRGKLVLDTTNPLDFSSGAPRLAFGHSDSLGERIQRALPGALVVKAFNTVGHAHMFRPDFAGGPPDMFICGDDEEAKRDVRGLLEDFGWDAVDVGGIEAARFLEPMAMVWMLHAARSGSTGHAFKLLRR